MGIRRNRPYGAEVRRRTTKSGPGDRRASQVLMRRICVRYEDGRRACFVPEAGEEFLSRDDVHRVAGMLHGGSESLEWGPALEEHTGPYDTGAV